MWLDWLAAECPEISDRTARKYMAVYGKGKRNLSSVLGLTPTEAYKQLGIIRDTAEPFAQHFTGNNDNYTPAHIIEKARTVLGTISLDPASCELAQQTVKAERYLTEEDDSLRSDCIWDGTIFLNPPYAAGLIDRFINKLLNSPYEQAILLTNNNTDTRWFHAAAIAAAAICFTSGRINFYTEDKEKTLPTNGQTFFYFGKNADHFCSVFSEVGLLMRVV